MMAISKTKGPQFLNHAIPIVEVLKEKPIYFLRIKII